jgi:hypothetical protein
MWLLSDVRTFNLHTSPMSWAVEILEDLGDLHVVQMPELAYASLDLSQNT